MGNEDYGFFGKCLINLFVIKSWMGDLLLCIFFIKKRISDGELCLDENVIG